MYIIYVRLLSDLNPRMHSGGFENRLGDSGTAAIVLASAPEAALENHFYMFPEYRRVCCLAKARPEGTAKKENTKA